MNNNLPILTKLFSLKDKVALVTGGAGGIGSVLASALAEAGAAVAVVDINESGASKVAVGIQQSGHKAEPFQVDLGSRESIMNMVDSVVNTFGGIDILINCAAINKREPILDVEEKTFDKIMGVDLKGLFQLSQAVVPVMISRGGGKIINFGSINTVIGLGGVSVYGAAKGAVAQVTKVMAIEWAKHNIQVNCISPGFMRTELSIPLWQDENKRDWMLNRIAAGRPGEPEELVGMVILLASDASSYITGANYLVDGGIEAGGSPW